MAAGLEDAGEFGDGFGLNEPALVMAGLGPRVGEEDEDPRERSVGKRAENLAGVALMQANVR